MERINKLYVIIGMVIAFGLFFEIAAHADEFDEATTVTFNAPVQIPGKLLPAGTYLFKLADDGSQPNLVQIFNSEGTQLYATVPTISSERQEPTDNTTITLAEQGSGKPDALLNWFYPGSLIGNHFLYSGREEKGLAQDRRQTIAAGSNTTDSETQAGD
jgi:hypothetical protein